MQANEDGRVVILGTGGTIAGRATQTGDNVGYVAAQVSVGALVDAVPLLQDLSLDVEQVAQVDSKDMDLSVWQALASQLAAHLARPEVRAVVVTHGTDTIEETAFVLQMLLAPRKPVVLTCAMRPSSALVPDGPQNLSDAVALACDGSLAGVTMVCAGMVHAARDVAKVHTYRLDAFDSGDEGPLAAVEEGRIRLFRVPALGQPLHDGGLLASFLAATALPRVELVFSHADADGGLVRALLAQADGDRPLRGIVVAGTGNGTVHKDLVAALEAARGQGVRVCLTSRCARGHVVTHPGLSFDEVSDLSPVKARLALALELLGSG
ncbi:MAG: asparaginase [Hydrogenophaga sp.]|nr:asparaginase [Hydrogenophaga sp.]